MYAQRQHDGADDAGEQDRARERQSKVEVKEE